MLVERLEKLHLLYPIYKKHRSLSNRCFPFPWVSMLQRFPFVQEQLKGAERCRKGCRKEKKLRSQQAHGRHGAAGGASGQKGNMWQVVTGRDRSAMVASAKKTRDSRWSQVSSVFISIMFLYGSIMFNSLPCTDVNVPALPAKCWTFEANCSHVLHPIQNERPIGYCYSYDYIMLWSGIELGKAICCSMFNYSFPHHLLACVVSTGALGQLWSLQLKPI